MIRPSSPDSRAYKLKLAGYGLFYFTFFSYGIIADMQQWWPSSMFRDAMEYYKATQEKNRMIRTVKSKPDLVSSLSIESILSKAKVDIIDGTRSEPGLTLVCGGTDACALVDAFGQMRQVWKLPFSNVWAHPPHIPKPVPDIMTLIHDGEVFPNGDLLAIYHGEGDTPYGYGLVKMDKKSHVIWKLPLNTHHDVYVANNGTIYTLAQKYQPNHIPELDGKYASPLLFDTIEIVSPDGESKDSIPVLDAFMGTPYEQVLYQKFNPFYTKTGDYTHSNSVMVLEDNIANKFPMFKAGQILVSLRNQNTLAVIDPETRKVVWAVEGIWKLQHEAGFLPNGHILLVDNNGYSNGYNEANNNEDPNQDDDQRASRILEIDPATGGVAWHFNGSADEYFYTKFRGTVQKLANGNYFVTSTAPAHKLMEITPDKEVVWRYTTFPKQEKVKSNNMFKAARIPFEFFDKDFLDSI